MQQLLGEDCLPDAEFFVGCWTVGAATAAGNLLDRQCLQRKENGKSADSWKFNTFSPSFSSEDFVRNQQMRASSLPSSQPGDVLSSNPPENEDPDQNWNNDFYNSDFDASDPLTVERARRLLGVAADSTPAQIKSAYRHLVRRCHPDRLEGRSTQVRQTATDRMIAINKAYYLLGSGRPMQAA